MGRHHAKENSWLEERKKKGDKEKIEKLYQQKVSQMIKSAEDSAGLFVKVTKRKMLERRSTDLEERRRRCQAVGPL